MVSDDSEHRHCPRCEAAIFVADRTLAALERIETSVAALERAVPPTPRPELHLVGTEEE